ncbi:MAG: SdpI family protein [Leptolinea sp.]
MKTKTVLIIVLSVGLIMLVASTLLSRQMGANLATHWNAAGEADGYGGTFMGLYLIPIITIVMTGFLLFVPNIDPLKANIVSFRSEYNLFVVFFAGFMFYVHSLTVAWNIGLQFSMNSLLIPAMGVFFILTGRMIGKAKRNFFIGIRTPWTLANDEVWNKTHQLGGKLFVASGLLTAASIIYPPAAIWVLLTTSIGAAIISTAYSFVVFREIERKIGDLK